MVRQKWLRTVVLLVALAMIAAACGGDDGMTLASRSLVAGSDWLENDFAFYWVCLFCLFGVHQDATGAAHA